MLWWMSHVQAGQQAILSIIQYDVMLYPVNADFNYDIAVIVLGQRNAVRNITKQLDVEVGHILYLMVFTQIGSFSLHAGTLTQDLSGSPLPFTVSPGTTSS
jgi:hypothetical protein